MVSTAKQKLQKKNSQGPNARKPGENPAGPTPPGSNPAPPDGSCSCSDTENRQEDASDNDAEASEIFMEGCVEDEILRRADALTIEEVARRRARRMKQLARLYRRHYWALMEELKFKYREFYINTGRSGWKVEAEEEAHQEREFLRGMENGLEVVKCAAFQGCKSKPMPLSSFCYVHILSDPLQQLYKPCSYVVKSGSGQAKPVTCGKPVLKAAVPSLCTVHFQKAQKHVARSLKRAGLNTSSSSKSVPKFHLIISEYVNHIQSKRREARIAGPVDNVDKEGICNLNANKDPSNH